MVEQVKLDPSDEKRLAKNAQIALTMKKTRER